MSLDKKPRAALDPEALRDLWTRAQRLEDDLEQIEAIANAVPEAHPGVEVTTLLDEVLSSVHLVNINIETIYRAVVTKLGDAELVLPLKKAPLGFATPATPVASRNVGISTTPWGEIDSHSCCPHCQTAMRKMRPGAAWADSVQAVWHCARCVSVYSEPTPTRSLSSRGQP